MCLNSSGSVYIRLICIRSFWLIFAKNILVRSVYKVQSKPIKEEVVSMILDHGTQVPFLVPYDAIKYISLTADVLIESITFLLWVIYSSPGNRYINRRKNSPRRGKESRKLQRMEMMSKIQSAAVSPMTMPDPGSILTYSLGPQFSCYQAASSFFQLSCTVN
jgi:hypothetical protein